LTDDFHNERLMLEEIHVPPWLRLGVVYRTAHGSAQGTLKIGSHGKCQAYHQTTVFGREVAPRNRPGRVDVQRRLEEPDGVHGLMVQAMDTIAIDMP
jgi:hypothetical protein